MKKTLKIITVLTIVGLLSGGILAIVYRFTFSSIQKQQEEALKRAVFKVIPQTKNYKLVQKKDIIYYECFDKEGNLVGYALPGKGTGYQGEIKLMLGINPNLTKFTGIIVLEQVETPGLGAKISEEKFQNQFKDLKLSLPLKDVDTITGATVSSKSVINIINREVQRWLPIR